MDNDMMQLDIESSESTSRNTRRRRSSVVHQSNGNATAIHDSSPFADILGSSPVPPPSSRPRRLATWADETTENIQHLQNLDNLTKTNKKKLDNSENEVIPMIPDLEDVNDQELIQQTAQAPTVQVNQLLSFQELDKNVLKHSAFTSLDGIDLTQLTNFCLPESQVKEEDITWNWDNLMSDVTSKLMPDRDSNI